jgi:glycosyltransferase involved in cell wall biosynthesis
MRVQQHRSHPSHQHQEHDSHLSTLGTDGDAVTLLYLADIRFPLERANGIQSMATCHALAARGHQVTMVVRPDTQTPPRDPYAFYGVARLPSLRIEVAPLTGPPAARRAGYLTFALGRALGQARQDLIVTRDLALASLLLRVPSAMRAPVVYEAHTIAADAAAARPAMLSGGASPSPAKLRRLAARDARVWRGADGYITITTGLRDELVRRFGSRSSVAVIPDGVHLPSTDVTVPPPRPHATAPFTIGYAGHLYPWKGVDLVLEAIVALPDTRGLIVGGHEAEPDLARLKQMALDLDCTSRVTFTGPVAPPEVAARLRDADVLLLPNRPSAISTEFTSPLKLFEYMAAGRPIVASDLPAFREILRDGENALLVEAGNPQALAAAVTRIKDDPALGVRLARQAAADVREYTWTRRAERLETLFQDVVGSRR